jgi:hypothetical protein
MVPSQATTSREYNTMRPLHKWSGLYKDIASYINNCPTLAKFKSGSKQHGQLNGHSNPVEFIAIDI